MSIAPDSVFVPIASKIPEVENIPADRDEGHPGMYAWGVAVTVLSAAAYVAPFFIVFPLAESVQIVALKVLTAVTFWIIKDHLACRQCIEYFTIGHTSTHKRLLKTDDPTLNGIVWGINGTWVQGSIAGVVLAIVARATKSVAVNAFMLTPVTMTVAVAVNLYAHIKSKQMEAHWNKPENKKELNSFFNNRQINPDEGYHVVDLDRIPEDKRAAYEAVAERNRIGYLGMPIGGLLMAIGIVAARVFIL